MASSHNTGSRSKLGSKRQKDNGRWLAIVSVGYRDDGRQRRQSKTFDTEAEADTWIAQMAAELGRRPELGRGITLAQYWDYYQATKGTRLVRATVRRYREEMERAWLPALGGKDVSLVTRQEIQEVILQGRSHSDSEKRKSTISAVLGQAVRDGVIEANPCRGARFELVGDTGAEWDEDPFDDDPFGAIEGTSGVWSARDVLEAMPRLAGAPLEPVWLAMVGAGLRMEEAFALRWRDVRRVELGGRDVTQVAVHHALTDADGRKRTKTARSVRIVAVSEPFGARLWELRPAGASSLPVCEVKPGNANRGWRKMWEPVVDSPKTAYDRPYTKGRMLDWRGEPAVPYVPLSRMRHTHESLMAQVGVSSDLIAAAHGHSQKVSYEHYQRPDTTAASARVEGLFVLDGGRGRRAAQG